VRKLYPLWITLRVAAYPSDFSLARIQEAMHASDPPQGTQQCKGLDFRVGDGLAHARRGCQKGSPFRNYIVD
jgi:hypothetical protein